jgi:hypothetical protein
VELQEEGEEEDDEEVVVLGEQRASKRPCLATIARSAALAYDPEIDGPELDEDMLYQGYEVPRHRRLRSVGRYNGFACPLCHHGEQYENGALVPDNEAVLRAHMLSAHPMLALPETNGDWNCPLWDCQMHFKSYEAFRWHCERYHFPGVRAHKCPDCPKGAVSRHGSRLALRAHREICNPQDVEERARLMSTREIWVSDEELDLLLLNTPDLTWEHLVQRGQVYPHVIDVDGEQGAEPEPPPGVQIMPPPEPDGRVDQRKVRKRRLVQLAPAEGQERDTSAFLPEVPTYGWEGPLPEFD